MDDIPVPDDHVWEVYYDNDLEHRKRTSRMISEPAESRKPFPDIFRKLRSCEREWSDRLGYPVIDDWSMHGGGAHCSYGGSWLQVHLDYSKHPKNNGQRRALNLIAFLNPEWKPEWGGALLLCDPSGKAVKRIYPEPGMLAAFETSSESYHGVEETRLDAPPRITAAVYYLASDDGRDTRCRALFVPNRNGGKVPQEVKLCHPIRV